MPKTIRLTTAQALIKFLNQQYIAFDGKEEAFVEGIFHIFGHGIVLGLGEALEEDPGHLTTYAGKNEQGMALAAIAYAKQKKRRKIFAVSASSGPGSANMLTAAATAYANNIPVLLLPADTWATRQPDPVLQQVENPLSTAISTNDAFKPLSRYWDRIERPEQLMSAMIKAFEALTSWENAGPVTICLPQDVEGMAYDYPVDFFEKKVHYLDRRPATGRELDVAVELIKSAKKSAVIVGGGAKYSEAGEAIKAFAEQFDVPLVMTHAGQSTLLSDEKYNMGGVGVLGTSSANQAVMNADLIIGIGTRYNDFVTASKSLFDFEHTQFININVSRVQTYKFAGHSIVADAKEAVTALSERLTGYRSSWGGILQEWKQEWELERERLAGIHYTGQDFEPEIAGHFTSEHLDDYSKTLRTHLTQTEVFLALNEALDDDAVIVTSAGSLPGEFQRLWKSKSLNSNHLEYGYSTMGYEIAGAFGAKLAEPDREVYAFVGDGSFLMLHTEIVTALQYSKKTNVLLFDNAGYGCINNLQMEHGEASNGTEWLDHQGKIMNIDYAKVAEGYGLKTYHIHSLEELREAVEDAKGQDKSTLFDIKVLPKTMSGDAVGSWWNVGISEVSSLPAVQKMSDQKLEERKSARQNY
ncbi:3D-(3,5/4)-trihydroxycyclohexane-1,2-dione acylhydrolase (decyclizing) [Lactococcus termiticola]|uniref:3D-(3,5/4)-trihydroxycyclohexane-1,2-dione hydrolase n=1 Tax=Lactococcus termiticola TaxID=2169526 RepID=A0A2R5HFW0_9LACT|nr:3D-(3,5/4)-trihydroxycyclohexane-1,2-dione acylhydrolase (decyclizing) [Lactococcus termiticola]GBG96949.1 3D-(3,5/4)-trihydroxycyclohexane-1,2-dione hydrolase [Lactococcus termiticola]